ncbi:MAG: helix-turn-helix domain-containing protein, partial [Candidatus Competibacterales bacterium]
MLHDPERFYLPRCAELRQARQWSVEQLAAEAKVPPSVVKTLEAGASRPAFDVRALLDALATDANTDANADHDVDGPSPPQRFFLRLEPYRQQLHLKIRDLARQAGVPVAAVKGFEKGLGGRRLYAIALFLTLAHHYYRRRGDLLNYCHAISLSAHRPAPPLGDEDLPDLSTLPPPEETAPLEEEQRQSLAQFLAAFGCDRLDNLPAAAAMALFAPSLDDGDVIETLSPGITAALAAEAAAEVGDGVGDRTEGAIDDGATEVDAETPPATSSPETAPAVDDATPSAIPAEPEQPAPPATAEVDPPAPPAEPTTTAPHRQRKLHQPHRTPT